MAGVNDERRSQIKIVVAQVPKRNYNHGGSRLGIGRAVDSARFCLNRTSFKSLPQQFSGHGAQLLGMLAQVGKQPLLLLLASAWRLPVDF